jgi:hypothetical protein
LLYQARVSRPTCLRREGTSEDLCSERLPDLLLNGVVCRIDLLEVEAEKAARLRIPTRQRNQCVASRINATG